MRSPNTKVITVVLKPDYYNELKEVAKSENVSVAKFVRTSVWAAMRKTVEAQELFNDD